MTAEHSGDARLVVEEVHPSGLLLRAGEPHRGCFNVTTFRYGGAVTGVRGYLYGAGAGAER
jgi:hypothetical protein